MSQLYDVSYGAIELKRCYQKNMLAGIGFSILIASLIALAIWVASFTSEPPVVTDDDIINGELYRFSLIRTSRP